MLKLKNKRYWFTLAEIVILCSLFSFLILWVIVAINRSFTFVNNTRLAVRAANFAREWMEMMYNIRDTNRRKHSWGRDAYWLCIQEDANWSCVKSFKQWFYTIEQGSNGALKAEEINIWGGCGYSYIKDLYKSEETFFNDPVCAWDITTETKMEYSDVIAESDVMTGALLDGVEFYRLVHVYGIYKKDVGNTNTEVSTTTELTNWTPAEMRFCVKVFYRDGNWKHSSELCGLMTNFTE